MNFLLCLSLVVLLVDCGYVNAFEWHVGGRPAVDRRAIAGLWRLTTKANPSYPLKEFTVYPKKNKLEEKKEELPELLLMLKEDGSFQQCNNEEADVDASWSKFSRLTSSDKSEEDTAYRLHRQLLHGTWDYRDGKLIIAADRPDEFSAKKDGVQRDPSKTLQPKKVSKEPDTLLTGRVVATYQTRLSDNPALPADAPSVSASPSTTSSSSSAGKAKSTVAVDTHLSVPQGSVKVGKFFYPKNHPSFFDQPMFQPIKRGTVQLRQVLGALNTANDEEEVVEKFQRSDFYNKTFLLTSQPIGYHKPKGRERWSIRQNKMVHDPPSKAAAKAAEEDANRPTNIRVMQVQFHANNTFSTVAGLGEGILRGKFDVIGQEKDQLWMQIWRFGFGRSVSGSVFSEGRMLTQEDAKTYWGTIKYEEPLPEKDNPKKVDEPNLVKPTEGGEGEAKVLARLEVEGSVMFGWGIEPIPEARFIMRELSNDDLADLSEEEDDDEDVVDEVDLKLPEKDLPSLGNDGIDLSNTDSFQ